MRKLVRAVALIALAASCASAMAQTSTRTFPGLAWSFSSGQSGFTGCSQLVLDATGGSTSDQYALYGYLNCPTLGGTYLSSGNGYFDASGNFNMQVLLGTGYKLLCTGISGFTFSGSCSIYSNSASQTGTAFISFQ